MTSTIPLRIASYNIRKALGTDRRRDPHRVLRVVAELGADVVALQEADLRLGQRKPVFVRDDIIERTGLVPVSFGHGRDSLGWHGNALLVSPGFQVVARHHHDLPGLEPRGMVSALLERREDGAKLRVMGVHLGLLRHSRRQQLSALLEMLPESDDIPTLVAGDFNERSLAVGLGRLARRFTILESGPTYHSRAPMFSLDRIAHAGGITGAEAQVFRSPEARLASDHLPLIADLKLPIRAE